MYTVRKLQSEETLSQFDLDGKVLKFNAPKSPTWAVIDESGNVHTTRNRLTGKLQYEMYSSKKTAQMVADHLNS